MLSIYQLKTPIQLLNLKLKCELKFINFLRHAALLPWHGSVARDGCCETAVGC
jgi:hypothetical protein